jgi:preprotein translocase subunit SecE
VARDRKRAKQRRERRAPRGAASATHSELHRADLPGALEHASSEVDEFDAALIRGAHGVPLPDALPESPAAEDDSGELAPNSGAGVATEVGDGSLGVAPRGGGNGAALPAADAEAEEAFGARDDAGRGAEAREHRRSLPARAVAFLRASWAELQRVQWPDRPQVSQATTVVLGFVAVAGVYLGAADWVAQKIINFIL